MENNIPLVIHYLQFVDIKTTDFKLCTFTSPFRLRKIGGHGKKISQIRDRQNLYHWNTKNWEIKGKYISSKHQTYLLLGKAFFRYVQSLLEPVAFQNSVVQPIILS